MIDRCKTFFKFTGGSGISFSPIMGKRRGLRWVRL